MQGVRDEKISNELASKNMRGIFFDNFCSEPWVLHNMLLESRTRADCVPENDKVWSGFKLERNLQEDKTKADFF